MGLWGAMEGLGWRHHQPGSPEGLGTAVSEAGGGEGGCGAAGVGGTRVSGQACVQAGLLRWWAGLSRGGAPALSGRAWSKGLGFCRKSGPPGQELPDRILS